MNLLITGFSRFPGVPVNVSELVVDIWARSTPNLWPFDVVRFEVLPTSYRGSATRIVELMSEFVPQYVLMFGVAGPESKVIRLERFAVNVDDAVIADAEGEVKHGRAICIAGPAAFKTSIDLAALRERLRQRSIGVEISNHAGTYVCNHAYYAAMQAATAIVPPPRVLFVHIPGCPTEASSEIRALAEQIQRDLSLLVESVASL